MRGLHQVSTAFPRPPGIKQDVTSPDLHIMMLTQRAQVLIQLLDTLFVRFYAFAGEALG